MTSSRVHRRCTCRRCGISFVEVLVSMVIMSVLMVSALKTIGAAAQSYAQLNTQAKGEMLAQELLGEIMAQQYAEGAGTTIGTESGELTGTRAMFDDVDDYHNWSASPPEFVDGTDYADLSGWTRSVKVRYVSFGNYSPSQGDTGFKLITVTVTYQDKVVATAVGVRTSGSDASILKIGASVQ